MSSPWIALLFTLATVGIGEGKGDRGPLRGQVVGADGRAIAGLDVLAVGGAWDGDPPMEFGQARTDASGRFALDLDDAMTDCDRPTLWAVGDGKVAASISLDRDDADGQPIRLVLESPSVASFLVAGPDGRPIEGARILPVRVARQVSEVPDAVARLASATTGRDGRVILQAFHPEEILEVRVVADGFGEQLRIFGSPGGMGEVGTRSITLTRTGKVSGRVVAEDPKSFFGLKVRVTSANLAVAEVTTDASGRFHVDAIAAGPITVRVSPREGQADLPGRVVRRNLEPGKSLEVEIPLRRGVKVAGVVLDESNGQPVAGALVSVLPTGPWEPVRTRTDELGRYETYVPSGLVGARILRAPAPYLCPPMSIGPRPVEVPPAIARFELPKLGLTKGVDITGRVVDEVGQAVAGAKVEGSWTHVEGRVRAARSAVSRSRSDGSFRLGPVTPDADLTLSANIGHSTTIRGVSIRPMKDQPVVLTLV
jgi:hypothetical protein